MSVERTLFGFGGAMIMLFSLLALFHHPAWLMKKPGLKTEAELALEKQHG